MRLRRALSAFLRFLAEMQFRCQSAACPLCGQKVAAGREKVLTAKTVDTMDVADILCPDGVLNEIMSKRKEYLGKLTSPITQGKDGRWFTRVPDPSKGDHGRRMIRGRTREEVEDKVIRFFAGIDAEMSKKCYTVGECWTAWLEWRKEHNLRLQASSMQIFWQYKRRWCDGTSFSALKITDVKKDDIVNFLLGHIREEGLTRKVAEALVGQVRGLMRWAYTQELIESNPFEKILLEDEVYPAAVPAKPKKAEDRVLSTQQSADLTESTEAHLKAHPEYLIDYGILIVQGTGMRAGEMVALQWDDIHHTDDWTRGYIDLTHSEHRIPSESGGRQRFEVGDTKTHYERKVPFGAKVGDVLHRLYEAQKAQGVDSSYVLESVTGRPTANALEKATLRRAAKADIGTVRPHRIRRTVASNLHHLKLDEATVARIMGHSEEVDREYYTYDVEEDRRVVTAMDSVTSCHQ